jgi:energy-coupling factor transporter ATP-binding protein EcfA2
VRFTSLTIESLPGIDRTFSLDALGRGALLVVGPNGSGKSRTGLALAALLFPEKARELDDGRARGELEHGGERIVAEFESGSVRWRRTNGERLQDPREGRAHAFHLPARSLWRTEGHDDFGRELAKRVAGGFDLDALTEPYHVGPRTGADLGKALHAARTNEKRALRELDGLAREDESIELLERQRREAAEAAREAARLRDAKSAAAAIRELQAAEARLSAFPAVLEHSRAEDQVTLEKADREWRAADEKAARAQREARQAAEALATLSAGVDENALRAARERLDLARRADEAARSAREGLARAEARLRTARANLGLVTDAPLPHSEALGELEVRAREERSTRGELAEVEQRLRIVASSNALTARTPHMVVGLVFVAIGVTLAIVVDPWFAALAGCGAGWFARALLTDGRERLTLRVKRDDLAKRLHEFEQQSAALRTSLGLAVGAPTVTLLESFAGRQELRAATVDREGQLARVGELERQRDEALVAVSRALGADGVLDASRAGAELDANERRLEARRTAVAKADGARRDAERAHDDAERTKARRAESFARLELEPGDLAGAERLLAQRPAYTQQRRERDQLVGRQNEALARLEEARHLAAIPADELERRLAKSEARASEHDALTERITAIKTRVEQARANDPWETAAAERARVEREAQDLFEDALVRLCAQHLCEEARREYREKSSPRVMQRADELLGRFTRGRYRLELGGGSRLEAVDAQNGRQLALDALSDGTRVQLLLAVRLAFAESMEAPGEKLPWILDEAFGAADGERLRELVGTVLEVASQGRQVVYLSAHPSEAALWAQIANEQRLPAPQVIDLGAVRGLARTAGDFVATPLPQRKRLPDPSTLSKDEWTGAVGADKPRRYDAPERLHLFHLLREDPHTLKGLVEDGIDSIGVFENARHQASAIIDDEKLEKRLAARVAVARAVITGWHVGRGRPLERDDVRKSGIPSEYAEPIAALADRYGRSAATLLSALEDGAERKRLLGKAMRDATLEKLRLSLQLHGVLDTSEPLDRDTVIGRGLAAAAEFGRTLEKGEAARIAVELINDLEASVVHAEAALVKPDEAAEAVEATAAISPAAATPAAIESATND